MALTPIEIVAQNVTKLNPNVFLQILFERAEVQDIIIELNTKNQLFIEGIQADGSPIESNNSTPGVYSRFTELLNDGRSFTYKGVSKRKESGEPYFLYDTGAWFNTFRVISAKTFVEITAADQLHDVDFTKDFGNNLVGLTDASLEILVDAIKDEFIKLVKEAILQGT